MNKTWNNETIEAAKQEVINAIDADDKRKAYRNLYNEVASVEYLTNTAKAKEDINYDGMTDWANDCTGDEWESIDDCIMCAEIAAANAIEAEADED